MKDPFYAVRSYDSKRENEEAPQIPAAEGTMGTIHLAPVLQGVMEYGGNRRAMLAVNGESVTVRKGDRVGIWSVVSIGEKQSSYHQQQEIFFGTALRHTAFLFAGTLFSVSPFCQCGKQNAGDETGNECSRNDGSDTPPIHGRTKRGKGKKLFNETCCYGRKRTFRFQSSCKECAYPGGSSESGGTYRENIVFGGTVTGSVTADLDHVTPKEALHAMLVSQGLIAREEGSTLIVVGESAMKMGEEQRNPINCLMRKRKKWRKGFASFPTASM